MNNLRYYVTGRWGFPLIVGLILIIFVSLFLSFGERKFHSLHRALFQWDGQHYLSIARDGYEKYPCEFNTDWICGNVGWFPFYPLIGGTIKFVTGLDARIVMRAVTWLAFLIGLLLLHRLVAMKYGERISRASIIALAVFPSSFYFVAGYPYAVYLVLAVTVFIFLEKERYWATILPAACLAVTYPSGLVIGLPLTWTLLSRWKSLSTKQRTALAAAILSVGFALFIYASYYWWKFDDFFLYQNFQAQSYYAHDVSFPLAVFYTSFVQYSVSNPINVMLIFVWLVAIVFYNRRIPVSWQLYVLGILLFTPIFGRTEAYYRHVIVAFPLFVMIALSLESARRKYVAAVYVPVAVVLMLTVFLAAFKKGSLM